MTIVLLRQRATDGTYRWFLSRALPIRDAEGRIIRWFGTNTDITELREAQASLLISEERIKKQASALAEVNKELVSFTYSVSHDLRAPLRTIDAFSRIVEEDYGAHLNAEASRCLTIVRKVAGYAGELIDDLLEFSRLGRQDMTSSREDRDLVESYNLGVNSYVVKPVDFSQFTEAVRQLGLYWILLNQRPSELYSEGRD